MIVVNVVVLNCHKSHHTHKPLELHFDVVLKMVLSLSLSLSSALSLFPVVRENVSLKLSGDSYKRRKFCY